jgi:hypothetical protein
MVSKSHCLLACITTLVATALPPVFLRGYDKPGLPRQEDIVHKMVDRANAWKEKDENEEKQLSYRERMAVDKLLPDGAPKDREEKVYEVVPVNGEPTPKLVEKNGKPPLPSDLREEEARLRKEREASRKRKDADSDNTIELNEELVGKYAFELVGEDVVEGRPVYTLTFKPKSKNLPVRRKLDYALNRMAGKVWVDQEDYEIAKADMRLIESVQLWWGLLASLREFALKFEQAKLPDGCWFVQHFDMTVDVRFLFTRVHLKQEDWLSDFKDSGSQESGVRSQKEAGTR